VTAVVDQSIHSFLEHTLFVADNDVRCVQFQHPLQTIVPVDYPAVQIVQVRCGITAAVQHYHRAQIRRNNRNYIQNHPLRTIAGLAECLYNFQALEELDTLLSGRQACQFCFQLCCQFIQVDLLEQLLNGLCAHFCNKFIAVLFPIGNIFLFGQQLLRHQVCRARIQHDKFGKVQYFFQTLL